MTVECFLKFFNKSNSMTSDDMIYNSEHNVNIPRFAIEEVVNEPGNKELNYYHYDERNGEYTMRRFYWTEGLYANFLLHNKPEQLKKMLNIGDLYRTIMSNVAKAEKAVDEQVSKWEKSDKEIQVALKNGDNDKYKGLMNNLRARAEEVIYRQMLYV